MAGIKKLFVNNVGVATEEHRCGSISALSGTEERHLAGRLSGDEIMLTEEKKLFCPARFLLGMAN